MDDLKETVLGLMEIIITLSVGFLFTYAFLKPFYEISGIIFMGNTWVIWFGVAYIFFFLYSMIIGLFILKENILFKQRRTSILFWLLFIGAIYVVFIPFVKGENPF